MARIRICVKEVRGYCAAGYKPGDCFELDRFLLRGEKPVCIHAFLAMSTLAYAMARGASARQLGIGEEDDAGYVSCPDPGPPRTRGGNVVFELRRVED